MTAAAIGPRIERRQGSPGRPLLGSPASEREGGWKSDLCSGSNVFLWEGGQLRAAQPCEPMVLIISVKGKMSATTSPPINTAMSTRMAGSSTLKSAASFLSTCSS